LIFLALIKWGIKSLLYQEIASTSASGTKTESFLIFEGFLFLFLAETVARFEI
jgi:hypothetical protein